MSDPRWNLSETYKDMYVGAPVGLWRTSIDRGIFLFANDETARIFGVENADALIGRAVTDFYDTARRHEFLSYLLDNTELKDYEISLTRADGSEILVAVSARIFPDDNYVQGTVKDITNERKFQDETALVTAQNIDKIKNINGIIKAKVESHRTP